MLFINERKMDKNERYGLEDVYGRGKICYHASAKRIVGWETPVSILFSAGEKINIRFKKKLLEYEPAAEPLVGRSVFDNDRQLGEVRDGSHSQLRRCIAAYRETHPEFMALQLQPQELQEFLKEKRETLLPMVYTLNTDSELFTSECYWFPVDVDGIIADFSNWRTIDQDEAVIASFSRPLQFGHVGFDKRFYAAVITEDGHQAWRVYTLSEKRAMEETASPPWLKNGDFRSFRYSFRKHYVIDGFNNCYSYEGQWLPDKSQYYKNMALLDDVIRCLSKREAVVYGEGPYWNLQLSAEFQLTAETIEQSVIPYLSSKNVLNETAADAFRSIKAIIEKAGVENEFGQVFENILELNKHSIYGGSKRNFCGKALLRCLQSLSEQRPKNELACILKNGISLKKEVARLNGVTVKTYAVSEEDYILIREKKRIRRSIKTDPQWQQLTAGTLVVFNCESHEEFCAVITSTKNGSGIRRA